MGYLPNSAFAAIFDAFALIPSVSRHAFVRLLKGVFLPFALIEIY